MTNAFFRYILILFLSVSINTGSALRCFHCSEFLSYGVEICKDPSNRTVPIKDCLNTQVCVLHQTPEALSIPEKTIRDCGSPDYCDTTAKEIEDKMKAYSISCSVCATDLCNFAPTTVITPFIIPVLIIISHYVLV